MYLDFVDVGDSKDFERCKLVTWDRVNFIGLDPEANYKRITLTIEAGDVVTVKAERHITEEEQKKIYPDVECKPNTFTEDYLLVSKTKDVQTLELMVKKVIPGPWKDGDAASCPSCGDIIYHNEYKERRPKD